MSTFEASILRVLKGNSVVSAAFLVSDRLVATCAHVVESAGAKVEEQILLRSSDGKEIDAVVEPEFIMLLYGGINDCWLQRFD